jgi:uncharacterized repeat protein (TIGR01451 family)
MAVDVVANVAGTFNNVTDDLTSNLGNSGSASASLSVNEAPGFGTGFSPTTIVPGQTAAMSFTVDNSGASEAANGLSFSLTLPSGLQVASPANIATSCGGTLAVNGDTLDYSGGTVAAGASCTVSIDVVAFAGTFAPTTALSSNLGSAPGAMLTGALTVNVIAVPTLSSISLVLLVLMTLLAGLGFGTRRLG